VPDSISEFRLWLWRFKFTSWIQLWKNGHQLILSFHRLDIFRRDKINITTIITSELQFNTVTDIARFKALQCNESGSWLDAIPSKNIGTFLDLQDFQVCVGLRLGCELFENHLCNCRTFVNAQGIHGLSCTKRKGRLPRHSELNSIIQRILSSIHIPATLEPTNLSRDDGKRPDFD
jgi:hypothetical protein